MKRFHVHVAVPELDAGIRFYSTLFGAEPAVRKDDYAKWMLDEPRINFAISHRGGPDGINHLGFQVDSDEELEALRANLEAAGNVVADRGANCCYARSDKYWVTDPAGIAWESFHTLGAIPMFNGTPDGRQAQSGAADETAAKASGASGAAKVKTACCAPTDAASASPVKRAACCS